MMSKLSAEIYWLSYTDLEEIGQIPPGIVELNLAKCGKSLISDKDLAIKMIVCLGVPQMLESEKKIISDVQMHFLMLLAK